MTSANTLIQLHNVSIILWMYHKFDFTEAQGPKLVQQSGTKCTFCSLIFHLKGLSSALDRSEHMLWGSWRAEGRGRMSTPLHVPICLSLFKIHVAEEPKTRLGKKARENTLLHVRRESTSASWIFWLYVQKQMCSYMRAGHVWPRLQSLKVPIKTIKPENCEAQLINIINHV